MPVTSSLTTNQPMDIESLSSPMRFNVPLITIRRSSLDDVAGRLMTYEVGSEHSAKSTGVEACMELLSRSIHMLGATSNKSSGILRNAYPYLSTVVWGKDGVESATEPFKHGQAKPHALGRDATRIDPHQGLLPFLATALLHEQAPDYVVHHDLESLFWMLLYVSYSAWSKSIGPLEAETPSAKKALLLLAGLNANDQFIVRNTKEGVLRESFVIVVKGPLAGMTNVLQLYAKACRDSNKRGADRIVLTVEKVEGLLRDAMKELAAFPVQMPRTSAFNTPEQAYSDLQPSDGEEAVGPYSETVSRDRLMVVPPGFCVLT